MGKSKDCPDALLVVLAVVLTFVVVIGIHQSGVHQYDGSYISRTLDGSIIYEDMSNNKAYALEEILAEKQITISKVDLPDSDLCGTFSFSPFTLVQIKGHTARIITYQ